MRTFLLQHINSLIMMAFGLCSLVVGFRAPEGQRRTKMLRRCGPVLFVCGLFCFAFAERPPAPDWQRYSTSDGLASAEFPATPEARQNTMEDNGVRTDAAILVCNFPYTQISLRLSFCAIPPERAGTPDADRYAWLQASLEQKGFAVVSESTAPFGPASGFALDVQRDAGKVRAWTRSVYAAGKAYWVVASSEDPGDDIAIIKRFLESFRIEQAGH